MTPAEPETTLRVEVTEVAHAVPEADPVLDLGAGGGVGQLIVAAGGGGTAGNDFTDCSGGAGTGGAEFRDGAGGRLL